VKVDRSGVSATTNLITGYVLVEAESHEQAASIFQNHPHFAVFSASNSVEIIEILEMPKA
jgi:transcription antitermination factor NusG